MPDERTLHHVKIWEQHFQQVCNGSLTCQIRKNDRDYKVWDLVELHEFRHGVGAYSGNSALVQITHMFRPGDSSPAADGLQLGWCAFSFKKIWTAVQDGR